MNNSSMFITVFVRRFLYYTLPNFLRPITGMEERSLAVKGKNGAYFEHLFWLIFFYFFWMAETSMTYYVKDFTIIENT